MKRIVYITVFLILSVTGFTGCKSNSPEAAAKEEVKAEQVAYTCPMHPEIVSDIPGKCPICGMNLVVKDDFEIDSTQVEIPEDTM